MQEIHNRFKKIMVANRGEIAIRVLRAGHELGLTTVAMFTFYLASLFGLSKAVEGVPVGIAYAVWSGLGTLLVAVIGIVWFGEQVSLLRVISTLLIVAGVGGLYLTSTLGA